MADIDAAPAPAGLTLHFDDLLEALSPAHRQALEWFRDRAGQTTGWPEPLPPDGTFLANKAKGIHKPAGWKHALSVRQTLNGPYADEEPQHRPDGTWSYRYDQEGPDPADRDKRFTNKSLMACMADRVPVGVLRQTKGKPNVQYAVLGVALVAGWDAGVFTLEGFAPTGINALQVPATAPVVAPAIAPVLAPSDADETPFDPADAIDARQAVLRAIKARARSAKVQEGLTGRLRTLLRHHGLRRPRRAGGGSHHTVLGPADQSCHQRPAAESRLAYALRLRACVHRSHHPDGYCCGDA